MGTIIQLIDSVDYIRNNCFQHQLHTALERSEHHVFQVTLADIIEKKQKLGKHDSIVSCMKQRTLFKFVNEIGSYLDGAPVMCYDQDPWQAYMDDSPYKGAYERIDSVLNVKAFALTTQWWVDFVNHRGRPAVFVPMWVLPEYCDSSQQFDQRTTHVGFVGALHPRRRELVEALKTVNVTVTVTPGSNLPYRQYLSALSKMQCFIHNEDMPIYIDDVKHNFNTGMWIKDIEAMSQGCFGIRCRGQGSETYANKLGTLLLYEDHREVPGLLDDIKRMDPEARQNLISSVVENIRTSDRWQETVTTLTA